MEKSPLRVAAVDLFALLPPERWEAESLAYLDASAELFEKMGNGEFMPTWPRAKAAAFLFSHGLELFFKACIAQAGEVFLWGHDLKRLHSAYQQRFPDADFVLRSGVAVFIEQNAPIPFYEFLKYPERIEEINKAWPAAIYIDVREWQKNVSLTAAEIRRVWPLVLVRFPRDIARWQNRVDGESEKLRTKRSKNTGETVYLLQHVHQLDDDREDITLIGIYSQRQGAESAIERMRAKPGFCQIAESFAVDEYEVDRDHWTEGFITIDG